MKDEVKTTDKVKVYNLVILDKSGSMSSIAHAAIDGFNETLGGIRSAQEKYADTQEHYVSLLTFCNCSTEYVYDCEPVGKVHNLTSADYRPCCGTPLFDAMGKGINDLYKKTKDIAGTSVIVTVITDGMENASREYNGKAIKALVERMSNESGWNFSYIGTNQDVESVATSISIHNSFYFEDTHEGMSMAWDRERKSRGRLFNAIDRTIGRRDGSASERLSEMKSRVGGNVNYREMKEFSHRITPDDIEHLGIGHVFVFGSNAEGQHLGGAARVARLKFGAVMGQGRGLQGQSYGIVTMDGMRTLRHEVYEFIDFAKGHPEKTFLVTRIGCGIAGYKVSDVAPLFADAMDVENIWLPKEFWKELV